MGKTIRHSAFQALSVLLDNTKLLMVLSPITHQPAELVNNIPVDVIVNSYKEEVDLDVSEYFKGLQEISIYRCVQTGYRFYYPMNLAGDDKLYEYLQKFDWYYVDWKWDYTIADALIAKGQKVMDIGCGYGEFLQHLKTQKDCNCTGLEFNDQSVKVARERGITIHKEFVQEHAKTNEGKYDIVSFFHLLEHIGDIDSFLTAAIKCLKPGGTLIICVPNNNPFCYQFKEFHSLNLPPHHMGMWDEASLRGLEKIYPISVVNIFKETLQRYGHYAGLYINDKARGNAMKRSLMTLAKPLMMGYFYINRKNIEAGSILAAYKKQA
jgi:2-polyprenyl-3-methyl-5-hydroxy-6-metoxy-1,4-benzoquinol methylase